MTRGQTIVMLMRAYGIEPDADPTDNYTDAGHSYYTPYLATAKRLGIASGIGANRFDPDRAITRQDMATLLYRALKLLGELPETANASGSTSASFGDEGEIASYAREAMAWFTHSGVISGSGGMLMPKAVSTRSQATQILYRLLK
jgi:hypothetical protein